MHAPVAGVPGVRMTQPLFGAPVQSASILHPARHTGELVPTSVQTSPALQSVWAGSHAFAPAPPSVPGAPSPLVPLLPLVPLSPPVPLVPLSVANPLDPLDPASSAASVEL